MLLKSGDSILAHVTYDGTTLSMNLQDLVTNKTFVLTQGDQHSAGRRRKYGLRRIYGQHRRSFSKPEDTVLDLRHAGAGPGNFGAGVLAAGGKLQHAAKRNAEPTAPPAQ